MAPTRKTIESIAIATAAGGLIGAVVPYVFHDPVAQGHVLAGAGIGSAMGLVAGLVLTGLDSIRERRGARVSQPSNPAHSLSALILNGLFLSLAGVLLCLAVRSGANDRRTLVLGALFFGLAYRLYVNIKLFSRAADPKQASSTSVDQPSTEDRSHDNR